MQIVSNEDNLHKMSNLFFGINKKYMTNLSSADLAQGVLKVKEKYLVITVG